MCYDQLEIFLKPFMVKVEMNRINIYLLKVVSQYLKIFKYLFFNNNILNKYSFSLQS